MSLIYQFGDHGENPSVENFVFISVIQKPNRKKFLFNEEVICFVFHTIIEKFFFKKKEENIIFFGIFPSEL